MFFLDVKRLERGLGKYYNLSGVSPTVENCTEFAKNDPDVSTFIKTASELE